MAIGCTSLVQRTISSTGAYKWNSTVQKNKAIAMASNVVDTMYLLPSALNVKVDGIQTITGKRRD